jgi:hypothetical protein
LRKVKDLQALLWSERGTCRGDEVADAFNLREAAIFLERRRSNTRRVLRRNSGSVLPCIDVYSTDVVDEAVENLVLHARERK